MNFKEIGKEELYNWLNFISRTDKQLLSVKEKKFLGEIRVGVLYNCKMIVIEDEEAEGHPFLSLISFTITKRYLNIYFMFTRTEYRGIGLNHAILSHIMEQYADEFDRIYVITSTLDSVAFYYNKGFKFWGLDKHFCLVAEFDKCDSDQPRKAFKVCKELYIGEPLSNEAIVDQLMGVVKNPNYNHSITELINKKIL